MDNEMYVQLVLLLEHCERKKKDFSDGPYYVYYSGA